MFMNMTDFPLTNLIPMSMLCVFVYVCLYHSVFLSRCLCELHFKIVNWVKSKTVHNATKN